MAVNSDYTEATPSLLIFPTNSSNGDRKCINIMIIDDTALERSKSLFLVLTTSDSNIDILNGRYLIKILDDDSKLFQFINN